MTSAAKTATAERRLRTRAQRSLPDQVRVSFVADAGAQTITARVVDWNDGGWGLELPAGIPVGMLVTLSGDGLGREPGSETVSTGRVAWCNPRGAVWRSGVSRAESGRQAGREAHSTAVAAESDFYEMLQLSPNADQETIHRVYRLLAQRYHPDNQDSGNPPMFRQLNEAFRTLGDPERRAAYDVEHQALRRLRWRIFDQKGSSQGVEAEKKKRQGVLGVLYAKRASQPDQPSMTLFEIEDLLGVPREHLDFCLWYLKENGFVVRTDNGRQAITVKGVDVVESHEEKATARPSHLLAEAAPRSSAARLLSGILQK